MSKTKKVGADNGYPCQWCSEDSLLNVGPGVFRDIDSDYGDGIPICGGCGGIGRQVNSMDFRERADKIGMKLRFAYADANESDQLSILKNLVAEVKEHFRRYGKEGDKSFAAHISNGGLDNLLIKLQAKRN